MSMFESDGGFQCLLKAIENCNSFDVLNHLLDIIIKPLQMFDCQWAMEFILKVLQIIEIKLSDPNDSFHDHNYE